ncbi:hypothetical protein BHM03_00042664 [Ensete ventricosum]|nr:hypothetical protein BHM03_00042664 [Ensete ventricosum]
MQCSLISSYFHDFTEERTMMLKVFPDDDLGSTAHGRKKEQEKGIHMTLTAMMPSISMLALPERGNVFVLGANTSRVGVDVTLIQDAKAQEPNIARYLAEARRLIGMTEYFKISHKPHVKNSRADALAKSASADTTDVELSAIPSVCRLTKSDGCSNSLSRGAPKHLMGSTDDSEDPDRKVTLQSSLWHQGRPAT